MAYSTDTHKPVRQVLSGKKIVESLRQRVKDDTVFRDICYLWSQRERARVQVTVGTLRLSLALEGFKYSKEQVADSLKFLASLGVGQLYTDSDKEVRALKNIKYSLQSVGRAALNSTDTLTSFNPAPSFMSLDAPAPAKAAVTAPEPRQEVLKDYKVVLTADIDGVPIPFEVKKRLTISNIVTLLNRIEAGNLL